MKLNKQLFGWLGASALLLTTACTNEEFVEPQGTTNQDLTEVYGNGSKIITLSVSSEAAVATRAGEIPNISDGSKVNMLFFEVYDLGATRSESTNVTEDLVYVTNVKDDKIKPIAVTSTSFPVSIKLAVNPDHKYQIALWAQHTENTNEDGSEPTINTAPFSFEHLTSVTVDYSSAKNNDELRDAFCATKSFEGNETNVSVVLHRPFAQLNVGTTGADYKNYMDGNIYPNKTIAYSKMVVKGVYNCIDIANDKVEKNTDEEFDGTATFEFAKLPAFMNYTFDKEDTNGFPSNYLTTGTIKTDGTGYVTFDANEKEEFLYVNLNHPTTSSNTTLKGYKTTYNTIDSKVEEKYMTETFKYMSMAYVLVPSEKAETVQENGNSYDTYTSSALTSVEVWFAGINENKEQEAGRKYFTVYQVPVHRNWRTNLLGGLWESDDTDPDDPSSLFYNVKICVNLCPIYFGENNGVNDPTKDNGYNGIFSGYFPTEEGKDLHDENNPKNNE